MRALHAVPLAALTAVLVIPAGGPAFGHSHNRSLTCAGVHPDENAPVITRKSVVINAPLNTIWKVQTDVENWPTWQPNITSLTKDTPGALRSGSVFRWATEGLDITSTVKKVEHGKCLAWGGPAQGIRRHPRIGRSPP